MPPTSSDVNLSFNFSDPGNFNLPPDAFVTEITSPDQSWTWSTTDLWLNNGFLTQDPNHPDRRAGAFIGGMYAVPTVATPVLKLSFDPKNNTDWNFKWVQQITAPDIEGVRLNPNKDVFGWSVYSTSNTPILTLRFDFGSYTTTLGTVVNTKVSDLVGDINSTVFASEGSVTAGFNREEWISFELNVNKNMDTQETSWSATIGSVNDLTNTFLMSGVLGILNGEVGGIGQVWDLSDKNLSADANRQLDDGTPVDTFGQAGANIMMVENLSVKGVPEPSSASLVLFSSLALLAARRRRRSHS